MSNIQFDCGLCMEDKSEQPEQVRIIAGSMVCSECIQDNIMPLFRAAIAYQHDYPPKWGQKEIEFEDFKQFLTQAERDEWELKAEEYNTPVPDRIYCSHKVQGPATDDGAASSTNCNNFVGTTNPEGGASHCHKCDGWTCRLCGGIDEAPADKKTDDDCMEIDHICKQKEADILHDPSLVDHYQRCPNPTCGIVVSLGAGCNAMDCHRCSTTFCYLCGEITTHESNHWALGSRCPRFGKPSDQNPIFDDAPAPVVQPLQRVPGEQITRAFAVARDHILRFDVVDNGQNLEMPPPANYDLEAEIIDIGDDFTRELEGAFGSVDDAPVPLREMDRLLGWLATNLGYIRMVETRFEVDAPEHPWPTTNLLRAARLGWHQRLHEDITTDFLPTFFEAIRQVVPPSALLRFSPNRPGVLRVREIYDAYMNWDMGEYTAAAVELQLYHQRRDAFLRRHRAQG